MKMCKAEQFSNFPSKTNIKPLFLLFRFDTDEKNVDVDSKAIAAHSKLHIRVSLVKNANGADSMIQIHIRNDRLKHPVNLLHLLWINLYENQIVTMDGTSGHTQATIPYRK